MTTLVAGQPGLLSVEWREYAGGPMATVTGVAIKITNLATMVVAIGPTSTGVATVSTGVNTYTWTVPGGQAPGDYLVEWTGTDAQLDTVSATEFISVRSGVAYTTLAAVKNGLGKVTVDDRDDMINLAIVSASRHIDNITGRRFYMDAVATARTFRLAGRIFQTFPPPHGYAAPLLYGTTRAAILVDDIASMTGLAIENGGLTGAAYVAIPTFSTGPDNALATGQPITQIETDALSLATAAIVRVTAIWGWPSVPDEVELATRLMAARLYRRKDSPQGFIASADWGSVRVSRTDPDVRALIEHLVVPGFA